MKHFPTYDRQQKGSEHITTSSLRKDLLLCMCCVCEVMCVLCPTSLFLNPEALELELSSLCMARDLSWFTKSLSDLRCDQYMNINNHLTPLSSIYISSIKISSSILQCDNALT